MADKQRFFGEFEVRSSTNVLFPYVGTLDGLEKWYAEKAVVVTEKAVDLYWDDEHHFAKLSSNKKSGVATIEFLGEDKKEISDANILKLTVQKNEMTNGVYLMIEEYTDLVDTQEEFQDLWESLVDDLKDVLGV